VGRCTLVHARVAGSPVPAARALTGSRTWYNIAMVEKEIAEIPLFAAISDEAVASVAAGGVTDVPAGQVLARAGDPGIGMFVVLDGSVLVERGDLHIEIPREGFFGELALLVPDSPRIARVRARTDARILAVPRETFDHLLETEPGFARALLRELAARLVQARTGH
jgi:CRP-like cAMP-binding protein